MVDIVVNDQQVTTVVEATDGNIVVETSGSTTVVSTVEESTVIVLDPVISVVTEEATNTVTVDQEVVTILTEGIQGPPGTSSWCVFKNVIGPTDDVTVDANSFIIGVTAFDVQGTLDNAGVLVVI